MSFLLLCFAQTDEAWIRRVLDASAPLAEREAAVKSLAKTRAGGTALLDLADSGKLPDELKATAAFACAASPDAGVRVAGAKKLPLPKSRDGTPLPPIAKLVEMPGDPKSGAAVYRNPKGPNCIACHQIGEEGKLVGPPLTTIGQKLSKEQMLEAILTPSASILMSFENWVVRTKDGEIKNGILTEDTDDHVTLKDAQGEFIDIPVASIALKKQLKLSLMPEGLTSAMSVQELADLVEYLTRQR